MPIRIRHERQRGFGYGPPQCKEIAFTELQPITLMCLGMQHVRRVSMNPREGHHHNSNRYSKYGAERPGHQQSKHLYAAAGTPVPESSRWDRPRFWLNAAPHAL